MKQITIKPYSIITASLLTLLPFQAPHADVPNTFATGDPILASEMNANFDALDTRLLALEGSSSTAQTINIDCDTDANAFANTTITDNTTYVLTGMCNGPIEVFRKRNVFIHGDATGTKDDGVMLQSGLTTNPYAAVAFWESSGELSNLTIDASNYVTAGSGYQWANAGALDGAVSVGQTSILRIYDTDILGGDYALNVYRSSYAKTYSNVNITGFNLAGVSASMNSHVELSDAISVIGNSSSTSSSPEVVTCGRNSHVDIKNGGTFTPATATTPDYPSSLSVYENGTIRVRSGSIQAAFNERINASSGGQIRILGNTAVTTGGIDANNGGQVRFENGTVAGGLDASDGSQIRFKNSSQSGGVVYANRNSVIRIDGSSSIDTTGYAFGAQHSSSMGFRDTVSVTGNPLGLYMNATAYIHDTVNFGNVGINCQARSNQLAVGTNSTLGDLGSCP